MTARAWLLAVGLAAAAALAGCQKPPADAYVAGSPNAAAASAVPIGNDAAGEPCRYALTASSVGGKRDALIFCGDWDQPAGRVAEFAGPGDPARLIALAQSGPWRTYIDRHFACGSPVPTHILSGASAELMQCTRHVGGWPQVALTASVGGRAFAADAVRPALETVERAIAVMTGEASPAAAASSSSEARRLVAQRGGGAAFGAGDEGRFFQEVRLGDAYNNIDEPVKAERAYRQALAIQQKILGRNDPGLALTIMKLAAQVAHQGNAPEADSLLARAAQLVAAHPDPLLAAELDFYRATAAAYAGNRDGAIGLAQHAETAFKRIAPAAAQDMQRASAAGPLGSESTTQAGVLRGGGLKRLISDQTPSTMQEQTAISSLAETMRLHATLLQQAGRYAEAATLARRTERLLTTSGLTVSNTAARSLRLIASNQAVSREYPEAAGTSAEAGSIFARVTPGERPQALNLLSEGYYLFKSGSVGAALDRFRRAGAILRSPSVPSGVPAASVVPWLEALSAASGNREQLDAEMFEAAQFAQSEATAQAIARATAALILANPKAAAIARGLDRKKAAVQRLQQARIFAQEQKASAQRLAALDRQLAAATKERAEAEDALQAVGGFKYSATEEKPISLAALQKVLAPREALAFFFVADAGSYGFFVRPHTIVAYKIPLTREQIGALIKRLRDTTTVKPGGLPTLDFAASYKLYSSLFGPVTNQLNDVTRITVATTGELLQYPMEALVTQPGIHVENADYRHVPFLVRRVALAYVPTPRILLNIRSEHTAKADLRPFIGFGDFRPASAAQLAASFPRRRCGDDARLLAGLEPLPGTRSQVETIARELGAGPGSAVVGAAFTKARLERPDLGQYRIILLATHAFFPEGRLHCLTDAAIAVSAPPGAANAAGEFLQPRDIERLKLNADLVALSACDTSGAGAGESLSGLARAFFVAGAHGLLVTHWPVVPGASVPLMEGTFARGNGGDGLRNSAQALRAAQLHMIDTAGSSAKAPIAISHPNYWAAFVLIGDGVRAVPGA